MVSPGNTAPEKRQSSSPIKATVASLGMVNQSPVATEVTSIPWATLVLNTVFLANSSSMCMLL